MTRKVIVVVLKLLQLHLQFAASAKSKKMSSAEGGICDSEYERKIFDALSSAFTTDGFSVTSHGTAVVSGFDRESLQLKCPKAKTKLGSIQLRNDKTIKLTLEDNQSVCDKGDDFYHFKAVAEKQPRDGMFQYKATMSFNSIRVSLKNPNGIFVASELSAAADLNLSVTGNSDCAAQIISVAVPEAQLMIEQKLAEIVEEHTKDWVDCDPNLSKAVFDEFEKEKTFTFASEHDIKTTVSVNVDVKAVDVLSVGCKSGSQTILIRTKQFRWIQTRFEGKFVDFCKEAKARKKQAFETFFVSGVFGLGFYASLQEKNARIVYQKRPKEETIAPSDCQKRVARELHKRLHLGLMDYLKKRTSAALKVAPNDVEVEETADFCVLPPLALAKGIEPSSRRKRQEDGGGSVSVYQYDYRGPIIKGALRFCTPTGWH